MTLLLSHSTGAKPHGCSQCGARFGDPSSCARHKRETHLYPEGYQCFMRGCRTRCVSSVCDRASSELTPSSARIKRRSAFVKHLREKHGLDMDNMSIEEAAAAAAAAGMVPFDVPKAATPPPDYGTAAQQPIYEGEALPTFPSDVVPKEEAYTPPSVVTPPPSIIDVVSSSEGYTWSSGDFIGSCFHLWITAFPSLLIGPPVRRQRDTRHWYCLRFRPTPDNGSRLLLLSPLLQPPARILRTTMVRDLNPGSFSFCRPGRHFQLFPIASRFGHGLQSYLRSERLWGL